MANNFTYHIRNWAEYNKALVKRGSITLWLDEKAVQGWLWKGKSKKRGRPPTYSDEAILCALMIRAIYHLPLRMLEGFLLSLMAALSLPLPVPCYTRICRRSKALGQKLKKLSSRRPTNIVFDSSGVKIYGEGEWKVRQHGRSKRRVWRKIHLAVCPTSHEIILSKLTESQKGDGAVASTMIRKLPKRTKLGYGDGAYDQNHCYEAIYRRGGILMSPPRRGGRLSDTAKKPWMEARNGAIRAIKGLGGDDEARKLWKMLSGYHIRSIAETAVYRFKQFFGRDFRSREFSRQKAELYAKSLAMNRMTRLGMPKFKWTLA